MDYCVSSINSGYDAVSLVKNGKVSITIIDVNLKGIEFGRGTAFTIKLAVNKKWSNFFK